MTYKRCFLQWFLMLLAYVTGGYFAWHYGLLWMIWQGDVTYMTSVIAGVFVIAVFYLGFASWRYDRDAEKASTWASFQVNRMRRLIADSGIGRATAQIATLLGLLGTVMGLMGQAKAIGGLNASDTQSLVGFLVTISKALSTAFYATMCGVIASILIAVMTTNLEYFIDRDEVA